MAPDLATARKRPAAYPSRAETFRAPPAVTATAPLLMAMAVSKVLTPVKESVPRPVLTIRPAVLAVLSAPTVTLAPAPPPPVRVTVGTVPAVSYTHLTLPTN
jgi:hypothetical protein